jgi:threonine/homoserine efflux transporter RhtA
MKDDLLRLLVGGIMGAAIASVCWCLYILHIQHEAVDHGVGQFICGKYGSGPEFRWTTPRVTTSGN